MCAGESEMDNGVRTNERGTYYDPKLDNRSVVQQPINSGAYAGNSRPGGKTAQDLENEARQRFKNGGSSEKKYNMNTAAGVKLYRESLQREADRVSHEKFLEQYERKMVEERQRQEMISKFNEQQAERERQEAIQRAAIQSVVQQPFRPITDVFERLKAEQAERKRMEQMDPPIIPLDPMRELLKGHPFYTAEKIYRGVGQAKEAVTDLYNRAEAIGKAQEEHLDYVKPY